MKMRSRIIIMCALAVAGAWLLWPRGGTPVTSPKPVAQATAVKPTTVPLVVTNRSRVAPETTGTPSAASTNRLAFRLTNTTKTIGQLVSNHHAILLENALIETDAKINLAIPKHLRATGDPGAFIVQARGAVNAAFRAALAGAGGQVVSYIPNNAYLVQLTSAGAAALTGNPLVQAVLPYEPYYKVQPSLLDAAVNQKPLPVGTYLTLGLYGGSAAATEAQIQNLGGTVLSRERSPFGSIVHVQPPADWLALVQLPGVQIVEPARRRVPANDLSRATVGVSPTSISPPANDYLGLTGKNVIVEVNDTGIDATHPDFSTGRVVGDSTNSLYDTDGHGTHVAGIIAGNGTESTTVIYAEGSTNPAVAGQYRGKAPDASLYSVGFFGLDLLAMQGDSYLQQTPALTNALISNNSWNYVGAGDYDLAAASYDAAVRDALPEVTGPQPVLFVFSAGNDGGGGDNGFDGNSDSILSPATAKNVITVGALEQNRNITNWVTWANGASNQWWLPMTDSSSQVASYSGRGNVGIGIEGTYGRFKPDVVAPGTMVVSTRSQAWDTNAYYNDTNYNSVTIPWQIVDTNLPGIYSMSIPKNAVGITIQLVPNNLSPNSFPTNLEIAVTATNYAGLDPNDPTTYDFATSNNVVNISGGSLAPFIASGHLYFAVADTTNIPVDFNLVETIITTNENNYLQVLQGMNDLLGPYYRYESGTSMAAADVSGVLALMQDYFTNRLNPPITPSPVLLKAMLINGARSAWSGQYGYAINSDINLEGWGLVNLSNSLPASISSTTGTTTPLFFADQSLTNVLATGDSRTYAVTTASTTSPVRITLAWTDPPGNPAAALKLVNSLGIVVTNLTTGKTYYGNNYAPSTPPYSYAYSVSNAPAFDSVNNVQTIVIPPAAGTSFSVTVIGQSVNVNAVTAESSRIVQDYALVIACDDATGGQISVSAPTSASAITPQVTTISGNNQVTFDQLVGANAPLLSTNTVLFGAGAGYVANAAVAIGQTNQWHFYVITNTTAYTNAAFVTFIPSTLAIPREGVFADSTENPTLPEANLDLYVASEPGLTNLDPSVISNCVFGNNGDSASLARGGTKFVAFTNSAPGQVYYVGVQCEDQMAGEYGFIGTFSLIPFSTMDANGNEYVNAFNVPAAIPDGNNQLPGVGYVFGLALQPIQLKNVIVSNTITHQNFGDLLGYLSHDNIDDTSSYATLNNHDSLGPVVDQLFVYDDSPTNPVTGSIKSDGPGSLQNFAGTQGSGVWLLTEIDDAETHTGRVENLQLKLEPQQPTNKTLVTITVPANSWVYTNVDVPVGANKLTVVGVDETASPSPVLMALQFDKNPTLLNNLAIVGLTNGPLQNSNSISYGPPLTPGRYYIGFDNPSATADTVEYGITIGYSTSAEMTADYPSTDTPLPLLDDAVTVSLLAMTNYGRHNSTIYVPPGVGIIQDFNVGLRVDHPRISDLVFTLINPKGIRYQLIENRGGNSTNGCGLTVITTNVFYGNPSGNGAPTTNSYNLGTTYGMLPITYNFYRIPDEMTVYYGTNPATFYVGSPDFILDTGFINNPPGPGGYGPRGTNSIPEILTVNYPPATAMNTSTYLTIIMNQFGAYNGGGYNSTAWTYTAGGVFTNYEYLAFTEDTNLTTTPIMYAPVPLVPTNNGNLYYQAEQSLSPLIGTSADGAWQLEVLDNRAGATNTATTLVSWRLEFTLINPNFLNKILPNLLGFVKQTNLVVANNIQWYEVNVPTIANFATNILDSATAPVNLWFSLYQTTTNTAGGDTELLINSTNGIGTPVLSTTSTPTLVPGTTYYLGVQNPNAFTVTNTVEVDFDHGNPIGSGGPSSFHFSAANASSSSLPARSGSQLSWTPAPGSHYQIQWKDSLTGSWNTIPNPSTTTINGVSTFTDDGSQTASFGSQRFYRLVWVP